MADHLIGTASKAVAEELSRELSKALQSFCNEGRDWIAIFRILRYTRTRLHALWECLPRENGSACNTQGRFLDTAIGYISMELGLLRRYDRTQERPMRSEPVYRWMGTLAELVELIYGLQELRRIDDGETTVNELAAPFGRVFGVDIEERNRYDAYLDMKCRKGGGHTYFLNKMRERLNLRI